jgi:RNA polymerase sigma-70 factor, ECF subfamily
MREKEDSDSNGDVTRLLVEWSKGDKESLSKLTPIVYSQLHKLAERALSRQQQHTLQPTALVNEAFIRLIDIKLVDWKSRAHFFAVAANIMRNVLVDYARSHYAEKRGGGRLALYLDEMVKWPGKEDVGLLELHEALTNLAAIDPRQSQIVEMRFFGGLTIEETADYLGVSTKTVTREWRSARAWLHQEISTILTIENRESTKNE